LLTPPLHSFRLPFQLYRARCTAVESGVTMAVHVGFPLCGPALPDNSPPAVIVVDNRCYYRVSGMHKLGRMEAESNKEKQRGKRLPPHEEGGSLRLSRPSAIPLCVIPWRTNGMTSFPLGRRSLHASDFPPRFQYHEFPLHVGMNVTPEGNLQRAAGRGYRS